MGLAAVRALDATQEERAKVGEYSCCGEESRAEMAAAGGLTVVALGTGAGSMQETF